MTQLTKILIRTWLCAIGTCGAAVVSGSNLWSFEGAVAERLNDEDIRLLREAVTAVVSDPVTPARRQWKNAQSGHRGELRTLAAFPGPNGIPCKRLQVSNHADGRSSKAAYTVCELPDGWKLVPTDFAPRPPLHSK